MMRLTYCVLLSCICNVINVSVGNSVVHTTLGPVRGKLVHDKTTNVSYYSYEGIPYAEPPVGELRFKPPVKKHAWRELFDATKPGRVCPQTETYYKRHQMSEDCLNLNLYVPANRTDNTLLPVMLSIHDGDFDSQSGRADPVYGPQLLVHKDIMVVTMNYRIGVLGYLSLCNTEVSGNAGVKDVLLAIGVVQENVMRFGGDPEKITLAGIGAGAVIIQLLMLTNQCDNLFRNAILLSGSILSSKYIQYHPRENAMLLARELGLNSSNDECLLKELKHVNAFDFVEAQESIRCKDPRRGFRYSGLFKPCIENKHEGAILTRRPIDLMREGAICNISILYGFNNKEGLEVIPVLTSEPQIIDKLNENMELLIPEDIDYPHGSVERRNLTKRIRDFYFSGGNITWENIENYINLVSDVHYAYWADLFVRLYVEKHSSPLYYYVFGADTELNWFKTFTNLTYPGPAHGDETGYVYVTSVTKPKYEHLSSEAKNLQDNLLEISKNFIYYGVLPSLWPATTQNGLHLAINTDSVGVVAERPIPERMSFWSSVYTEYSTYTGNNSSYY